MKDLTLYVYLQVEMYLCSLCAEAHHHQNKDISSF